MSEIIVKLGDNVVHKYFFDKDIINIGRARDNDIVIENLAVSRNHARIRRVDGKYILTDLNSANGTFVNGVRITKTEIMHNDVITIGKHNLIFINKPLSDEQIISDAFGADRTMIVDRAPTGVLVITTGKQKNQEFKLTKQETKIGRSANNDIRIHDWFVSKNHAVIIKQGSNYFIKDLGSWRGVFVNGQPVKDTQLKDGDDIKLGATHLTFHLRTEEPLKITGRVPKELAYEEYEEEMGAVETPVIESSVAENVSEEVVRENISVEEELSVGFEKLDEEEEAYEEEIAEEAVVQEEEEIVHMEEEVFTPGEEQPEERVKVEEDITEDAFATEETGEKEEEEEKEEVAIATPSESLAEKTEEQEVVEEPAGEIKSEDALRKEIEIWEKALKNKSPVIRREAARQLKKLTGKDYEF